MLQIKFTTDAHGAALYDPVLSQIALTFQRNSLMNNEHSYFINKNRKSIHAIPGYPAVVWTGSRAVQPSTLQNWNGRNWYIFAFTQTYLIKMSFYH